MNYSKPKTLASNFVVVKEKGYSVSLARNISPEHFCNVNCPK